MIDYNKPIKTYDGHKATFLRQINDPFFPVIAYITNPDGTEKSHAYTLEGKVNANGNIHCLDLINVPEEPKMSELEKMTKERDDDQYCTYDDMLRKCNTMLAHDQGVAFTRIEALIQKCSGLHHELASATERAQSERHAAKQLEEQCFNLRNEVKTYQEAFTASEAENSRFRVEGVRLQSQRDLLRRELASERAAKL